MADEIGMDVAKRLATLEHDVGGDLGLVEHPVVAAVVGGPDGGDERVDSPSEGVEDARPGLVDEVLAQRGRLLEVVDA